MMALLECCKLQCTDKTQIQVHNEPLAVYAFSPYPPLCVLTRRVWRPGRRQDVKRCFWLEDVLFRFRNRRPVGPVAVPLRYMAFDPLASRSATLWPPTGVLTRANAALKGLPQQHRHSSLADGQGHTLRIACRSHKNKTSPFRRGCTVGCLYMRNAARESVWLYAPIGTFWKYIYISNG